MYQILPGIAFEGFVCASVCVCVCVWTHANRGDRGLQSLRPDRRERRQEVEVLVRIGNEKGECGIRGGNDKSGNGDSQGYELAIGGDR